MSKLDDFWLQIEKGQVVRRIAFFGMMWMSYETIMWSMAYVSAIQGDVSTAHAMLIGAVLTPITALQAAIIKFYAENPYKPNLMFDMMKDKKEDDE